MTILSAWSQFWVVGVGALALMLAEAFGTRVGGDGPPKYPGGLAVGAAIVLFTGAIFAGAVWMVGPEQVTDASSVAPWLILDRFTLFFQMLLCLGGAIAALLAGGYLPEHQIDRGEFYALLLFATFG